MSGLESKFKTELVTACHKRGWYARRHEDKYAAGLLDLSIKAPGHPHLLAESKLVPHQSFGPTLAQYEEGRRYQAAGGLVALFGWDPKDKTMFIHRWGKAAQKNTSFPPGGSFKTHIETLEDWLIWLRTSSTN